MSEPNWDEMMKALQELADSQARSAVAAAYTDVAHKFSGTVEKVTQYAEVINYCIAQATAIGGKP